MKNTSLAPVTVEGLAADDGASPYLATKILLGDGLDAGEANTRTFASFTPWPGATNGVVVVFTPQRDCARLPTTAPQPGAFRVYVEVQLRLRVLGVPRKQWVPIGVTSSGAFRVQTPTRAECEAR